MATTKKFVFVCTQYGEFGIQINDSTTASNLIDAVKRKNPRLQTLGLIITIYFNGNELSSQQNIASLTDTSEQSFYLKSIASPASLSSSDGSDTEVQITLKKMGYTAEEIELATRKHPESVVNCVQYLQSRSTTEGFFTDHA